MHLAGLTIYPLKSGAGIELQRAPLIATGLLHDRRFMLVDRAGDFVTLRGHPRLVTVHAAIEDEVRVRFTCAGDDAGVRRSLLGPRPVAPIEPLVVSLAPDDGEPAQIEVQIWGDYLPATAVSQAADAWFSALLGKPVQLVRFDEPVRRQVELPYAQPGDSVHFADGFPLLLTGTASLALLSEQLGSEVAMSRFRPNLVIATSEPFVEDRWRQIRVGSIVVDIVKPCARCVGVNVEPGTGRTSKEPLATLARFRTRDGKVFFGHNAINRGVGVLSLGDHVEVVAMEP